MTSFHKPKLYRSQDGCCICRAKSSSSRFTSSKKYEAHFSECFKLSELRSGEVCNACVLIVKRWKKLPSNSVKDWAHVVDARVGPGVKNVQRPREENQNTFPKIRRKHLVRKPAPIENKAEATSEIQDIPGFLDTSYWTRKTVCCGIIYIGLLNEVMLDQRSYRKCSNHQISQTPVGDQGIDLSKNNGDAKTKTIDDAAFSEYSVCSDTESDTSKEETFDHHDTDTDEGFYDKNLPSLSN